MGSRDVDKSRVTLLNNCIWSCESFNTDSPNNGGAIYNQNSGRQSY